MKYFYYIYIFIEHVLVYMKYKIFFVSIRVKQVLFDLHGKSIGDIDKYLSICHFKHKHRGYTISPICDVDRADHIPYIQISAVDIVY